MINLFKRKGDIITIHAGEHWAAHATDRDGHMRWRVRDGIERCPYCGSISMDELMTALDNKPFVVNPWLINNGQQLKPFEQVAEEAKTWAGAELADMKYGWPHKFYIDSPPRYAHVKFYSQHLRDADDDVFEACANILARHAGVRFTRDEVGIKYVFVGREVPQQRTGQ